MDRRLLFSMLLLLALICWQSALAGITPTSVTITLNPTESFTESKTVDLPGSIPKGDIMFSFDLTGSMSGQINTAKARALDIMNSLDALITDSRFAVASYMDYPGTYSSCGYSNTYGDAYSGDYAYNLDQSMTSNRTVVSDAINGLTLGWGADSPQDYTRIMYESYADGTIGYRAGAKKILVNFADDVPHDCDINEGVPGTVGALSTGGDPGRDGVMGTADDLDLQSVLSEMAANYVTLLEVHSTSYASEYWQHWTGITGGQHYILSSPGDIPQAIFDLIQAQATEISVLTLKVTTPGYESWLTSVIPAAYYDLTLPSTAGFDIVVTVPSDATPGTHVFTISAMADGASYGDQLVTVTVPESSVGSIFGQVTLGGSALRGVIINLMLDDEILASTATDEFGNYEFGDLANDDYIVDLQVPLGMRPVGESVVPVTVSNQSVEVNFELANVATGKIHDIWWWKTQLQYIRDKKPSVISMANVNAFCQTIYKHFYLRDDGYAIQIENITYAPGPEALDFYDVLNFMVTLAADNSYQACAARGLLTNLLNIAAGYQSQLALVSDDGATASQAITYFAGLYNLGGNVAYYSVHINTRRMHMGQMIPAGIIPLMTPNIMFKQEQKVVIPSDYSLSQNYPNPFNPVTTIELALPTASDWTIAIFNVSGQKVAEYSGHNEAGIVTVNWDASNLASGLYFYKSNAGNFSATKKMVLLK
jgi:hypothetical protein